MNARLRTYSQPTLLDIPSATSSPVLVDGHTHCSLPDGQPTNLCGQDRAHASLSVLLGKGKARKTNATCGQSSPASSASVALQSSLENRLRQLLDINGSMEYLQAWRLKVTPAGRRYLAHTASARRTSDSGCIGWPTPQVCNGPKMGTNRGKDHGGARRRITPQNVEGIIAGWTTASASDGERAGTITDNMTGSSLPQMARAAGWRSPDAMECGGAQDAEKRLEGGHALRLQDQATLAGWATPRSGKTTDENSETWKARNQAGDVATMPLTLQSNMAGWPTPSANEDAAGTEKGDMQVMLSHVSLKCGTEANGTTAATEKQDAYRLNPLFSLWLMGFPAEWACSGARAMQSYRKSRRHLYDQVSSKPHTEEPCTRSR